MPGMSLDRKAELIYEFIHTTIRKWGSSPPRIVMESQFKLTSAEVIVCLETLKAKGYITFEPRHWADIKLVNPDVANCYLKQGAVPRLPKRPSTKPKRPAHTSDSAKAERRFERALQIIRTQPDFEQYTEPLTRLKREFGITFPWGSSLEIAVAAEFVRRGYKVKPQHQVEDHRFDLYVHRLRLLVEVDGALYHSQQGSFERDRKAIGWALQKHYKVARLTEEEILPDLSGTVERALACIRRGFVYSKQLNHITSPEAQRQYVESMVAATTKPKWQMPSPEMVLERLRAAIEEEPRRHRERMTKREQLRKMREALKEEGHDGSTDTPGDPEVS